MSEAIAIFCCRSCLKGGGNDREYYDALGIQYPKTATIDDIKKAYKKKSLETHPDKLKQRGVEITPELQQSFLKLKEAYDVLSDPRKRRLYDELGASGMKLIDSPTEVDPFELLKNFQSNTADRWKIFIFIGFIFSVILSLPILVSLKCDNTLSASWMAIWTPMWLLDAVFLIVVCLTIVASKAEQTDEEGNPIEDETEKWYVKLLMLIQTAAFVLIQIFVFLRLDGNISWSWFTVFIPWYIFEGLNIVELLLVALSPVAAPDLEAYHEMAPDSDDDWSDADSLRKLKLEAKYYEDQLNQFSARKDIVVCLLRVWFSLFLAAQIDHKVDWDWGLVMLPVWLYFLLHLYTWRYLKKWGATLLAGIDIEGLRNGSVPFDPKMQVRLQVGSEVEAAAATSFNSRILHLLFALLLVSRLQVSKFSTFLVLFPIFFSIFICICIVGCGLCCLSNIDPEQLREQRGQMYQETPAQGSVAEDSSHPLQSSVEDPKSKPDDHPVSRVENGSDQYGSFRSTEPVTSTADKVDSVSKPSEVDID